MSIFIISEIGINHNGDIKIAKSLIDMAKNAGCDAVKFQKRTIDIVYSKEILDLPRESPWGTTQREQKEGLEFGKEEYDLIDTYCKERGIEWFASAWDLESQLFLHQYNNKYNKIASAMVTNIPLLEMVADEGKHTFLSTGMSTFEQIDLAVEIFNKANCPYTVMHCVSTYPCPDEECNVAMIPVLKKRYGCRVGYSGHEIGILPSELAVALGAEVIERHITLNRAMYGSDHAASLEKRGLELLVRDCRYVKSIIGTGEKIVLSKEEEVARKLRYFRDK
ncbi:N-acetylneuraminate synthase family protein [Thermodesulfobacteriota bacterium]